jgi:hypothetical protein
VYRVNSAGTRWIALLRAKNGHRQTCVKTAWLLDGRTEIVFGVMEIDQRHLVQKVPQLAGIPRDSFRARTTALLDSFEGDERLIEPHLRGFLDRELRMGQLESCSLIDIDFLFLGDKRRRGLLQMAGDCDMFKRSLKPYARMALFTIFGCLLNDKSMAFTVAFRRLSIERIKSLRLDKHLMHGDSEQKMAAFRLARLLFRKYPIEQFPEVLNSKQPACDIFAMMHAQWLQHNPERHLSPSGSRLASEYLTSPSPHAADDRVVTQSLTRQPAAVVGATRIGGRCSVSYVDVVKPNSELLGALWPCMSRLWRLWRQDQWWYESHFELCSSTADDVIKFQSASSGGVYSGAATGTTVAKAGIVRGLMLFVLALNPDTWSSSRRLLHRALKWLGRTKLVPLGASLHRKSRTMPWSVMPSHHRSSGVRRWPSGYETSCTRLLPSPGLTVNVHRSRPGQALCVSACLAIVRILLVQKVKTWRWEKAATWPRAPWAAVR